jgi:carbon storage regulator
MLVLTRRKNEGIKIGTDVEVVVLAIEGNRVRLGFSAPAAAHIRRTELPSLANGSNAGCTPKAKE